MEAVLTQLRACADPTRLRLLALCARGAFCVVELTDILGQSQPRLSRHLRLLSEAGLLECSREGARAWFSLSASGLGRALLAHLPETEKLLDADARGAARVLGERTRIASADFQRQGAHWDEMRALGLPAARVEQALLALLPPAPPETRLLDIGTGTGRLLELLAPHAYACLGIDASPAMLALARARLARADLAHCRVRRGDMYRLDVPSAAFDLVTLHMVLHHAEDPPAVLAEAARVLRPGGALIVADLDNPGGVAAHLDSPGGALVAAHLDSHHGSGDRWPGFSNAAMRQMIAATGLVPRPGAAISGPRTVRLWSARRPPNPAAGCTA